MVPKDTPSLGKRVTVLCRLLCECLQRLGPTVIEAWRGKKMRLEVSSLRFEEGITLSGSTRTHYVDRSEEDFVRVKDGVLARL